MKLNEKSPPRNFVVGDQGQITLHDCGSLELGANEMITLRTGAGSEWDIVRKDWGFYATPSLNDRLFRSGFKAAIVRGLNRKRFVMLVEHGKEQTFLDYIAAEGTVVERWIYEFSDGPIMPQVSERA